MADNEQRKKRDRYARALSILCFSGESIYRAALENRPIRKAWYRSILETRTSKPIEDAASLKHALEGFSTKGNRYGFNHWTRMLSSSSEAERASYMKSHTEGEELTIKLHIVNHYLRSLPAGGIAAFDYAWGACFCLAGLALGYLTREEYDAYLLQFAASAQRDYKDWGEYVIGFAAGTQYVNRDLSFSYMQENKVVLTQLLTSRHSPFQKVSWNLNLGQEE
ncbi:DUF1266 domain-containing protein [Paenibacillus sp. NPDC058071]|uniref:DUF1266 domain-containing protein n=1 Tax=Paenibacillus sp. NPDC058071 TaxID=3346326 RepID=UPI0036DDD4E3